MDFSDFKQGVSLAKKSVRSLSQKNIKYIHIPFLCQKQMRKASKRKHELTMNDRLLNSDELEFQKRISTMSINNWGNNNRKHTIYNMFHSEL